ncbi:hypothetical protein DL96DRAFT_1797455 [Flagelloscypha sp. PMI_526]|nr:hypothetical protein DL96DRAFT_1797455 [Flagelloscypha sp. PMI_526]
MAIEVLPWHPLPPYASMISIACSYLVLLAVAPLVASKPLQFAQYQPRAQYNPNPTVDGNAVDGWRFLPNVTDFARYPSWELESGVSIPLFQSSGKTASNIKRAVIVLPGKLRDCWYYGNSMQNALYIAVEKNIGINLGEVSIMAPCFFTDQDRAAGALGPSTISKYSSYKVVDKLVSHYMDQTLYPNLNAVVVAGHSLGAQMAQRYAALRTSDSQASRLHYWVANAGSLLWLTENRPLPDASCTGFDYFKYGLAGDFPGYATSQANDLGRDGLVARYNQRQIHYAWGLNDNGNGDTRCEAMARYSTSSIGLNFVAMLNGMGGVPAAQTVDWVPGISHYNEGMMNSDQGIDKLFHLNYNGHWGI